LWAGGASAKPKVTCTQFFANTADFGGGAIASTGSADPYLRHNAVIDNNAPYGGGIAARAYFCTGFAEAWSDPPAWPRGLAEAALSVWIIITGNWDGMKAKFGKSRAKPPTV